MNIAIPLAEDGSFSLHYGGSAKVGLYQVDPSKRTILSATEIVPPAAEPCEWAAWLGTQKINIILVGGMGRGAQVRMTELGIAVIAGLPTAEPRDLVQAWLDGRIAAGTNACEGGHHGHEHHHEHGEHLSDGHACHCSH